jgi:hypothetical protein
MELIKHPRELQVSDQRKRDAMEEAMIMMHLPMSSLPKISLDYLKELSSKVGFCGEVCVTAYAAYCQAILGMPCEDEGYKIEPDAKKWFEENKHKYE